jgi:predicted acetyltransferase
MSFEIRPLTEEDIPAFRQAIAAGFGEDADLEDETSLERFKALFRRDRSFPVFDGDQMVGTGGDFEFQMTVPGGAQAATAGLTIVTVRPTHTRQGALSAMMREHFDRARQRGEILGALWASERAIYGRFGYGPAVVQHAIKIDARQAGRGGFEPGVNVRLVELDEAKQLLPPLYARLQATRAGMYQRSDDWWKYQLFYDPQKWRDGASAVRHVVAEADGEPVGYASYRQKMDWDHIAGGEVRIREVIPVTDAGFRALWHYLLNIDLFPILKHWNNAVDDPLPMLLRDGRALETTGLADGLWVRLIDLTAALAQRTYPRDGNLVIDVTDRWCPWNEGRFRLTVAEGAAQCEPTTDDPELTMDVGTLSALYLGGQSAVGLARAGLIEGKPADIAAASEMFRTAPLPWCAEVF